MHSFHITFVRDGRVYSRVLKEEQLKEALGPENKWFTAQAVGHDPNQREMIEHYIINSSPFSQFKVG